MANRLPREVLIEGRLPAVVVAEDSEREQSQVRIGPAPSVRVWLPRVLLTPLETLSTPPVMEDVHEY